MMSLPQSILLSVLILAATIIAVSFKPVEAQSRRAGYMVATAGTSQFAWRVNTVDGSLTYCIRFDDNITQNIVARRKPYCSDFVIANH